MPKLNILKWKKDAIPTFADPEMIKEAAAPIFIYRSQKVGVLLIHGFTGTPASLGDLANHLADRNLTVFAPLLAGHGGDLNEMASAGILEWQQSVNNAFLSLSEVVDHVYVVGSSLGGNLAFYLAMQFNRLVSGVVSVNTPIKIHYQWLYKIALNTYGYFKKYQKKSRLFYRVPERQRQLDLYPVMPVASIRNFFKFIEEITIPQLAKITTPTLIIQSLNDPVIVSNSAHYIYHHLGATDKELIFVEKNGHTLARTPELFEESDRIFDLIYNFIAEAQE